MGVGVGSAGGFRTADTQHAGHEHALTTGGVQRHTLALAHAAGSAPHAVWNGCGVARRLWLRLRGTTRSTVAARGGTAAATGGVLGRVTRLPPLLLLLLLFLLLLLTLPLLRRWRW